VLIATIALAIDPSGGLCLSSSRHLFERAAAYRSYAVILSVQVFINRSVFRRGLGLWRHCNIFADEKPRWDGHQIHLPRIGKVANLTKWGTHEARVAMLTMGLSVG